MANMLTTKEATLISDLLTLEEIACKKAKYYSKTFLDPETAEFFRALEQKHAKRFNELFDMLNGGQNV